MHIIIIYFESDSNIHIIIISFESDIIRTSHMSFGSLGGTDLHLHSQTPASTVWPLGLWVRKFPPENFQKFPEIC